MIAGASNLTTLIQVINYIGLVITSLLITQHCQVHTGASIDAFTFNCTAMTIR